MYKVILGDVIDDDVYTFTFDTKEELFNFIEVCIRNNYEIRVSYGG